VRSTLAETPQGNAVTERIITCFSLRLFPNTLLLFAANPRRVLGSDSLACLSTTDSQGRSVRMKPPTSELIMYIFLIAGEGEQGFGEGGSAGRYHGASPKSVTHRQALLLSPQQERSMEKGAQV